ncbi:site-specific integrase [Rhodococcus sp. MS13]|nr:site-specific integrase [Rhodococcus sp. MS13]
MHELAAAMPDHLAAAVHLAVWSGLCASELFGLDRSRIDLDAGSVRVDRSLIVLRGKFVEFGPPKSDAGRRTVHLPPHVVAILREHMRDHTAADPAALIFARPDTGGPILDATRTRAFDKARRTIDRPELRWHDLRHTGATLAARAGATPRELQHRFGHATAQASMIYQHADAQRDRELAHRMTGAYSAPVSEPLRSVAGQWYTSQDELRCVRTRSGRPSSGGPTVGRAIVGAPGRHASCPRRRDDSDGTRRTECGASSLRPRIAPSTRRRRPTRICSRGGRRRCPGCQIRACRRRLGLARQAPAVRQCLRAHHLSPGRRLLRRARPPNHGHPVRACLRSARTCRRAHGGRRVRRDSGPHHTRRRTAADRRHVRFHPHPRPGRAARVRPVGSLIPPGLLPGGSRRRAYLHVRVGP